ncbi:MAG: glycoside hydrolase family 10 protein [Xenococcaceae cyanobacterium MO_188.B29]|nr:glycoside hydrolase family 10 protein [Xenococcaceae cyanobacterium MO_188.B29]
MRKSMENYVSKLFNYWANSLVLFSQRYGRQGWLTFLFSLTLTIIIFFPSISNTQEVVDLNKEKLTGTQLAQKTGACAIKDISRELRGVWLTNIDSEVLFSPRNLKDAIASLADLNFNTLYPTVWNWGYTLYPSSVAKAVVGKAVDPTEGLKGRDILAETIQQGRKKGMTVIPWFEFGFMAPAESELAQRHPEWLTKRKDGSTIWWEGKKHQRVWLNPLRPEVQNFITDLIVEIVSNYDVDGIQLDDHFGFPSDFGYDEFTVELYKQEHGGKSPPENPKDPEWVQWRADKITEYVEQLFYAIKDANPQAIISLSPNPYKFSLQSFLLDWRKWQQKGLVEELIIQVYRHEHDSFVRELNQPEIKEAQEHIPVGIGILSGLKGRPVPMGRIQQQVDFTRSKNLAGVSFFFYESLWNLASEPALNRQYRLQFLFQGKAQRPDLDNTTFSCS